MRSFRRALTGTLTALAIAASGIALAPAASADPSDGKGCAGVKTVPAAYVCIISTSPQNAVPTVSSTPIPVSVPPICYVADCTAPTTVNVPVPGVTPGSGVVAVLWYQGVYYPIAVGSIPPIPPIPPVPPVVFSTVQTVIDIANGAVALVVDEAGAVIDIVNSVDLPPATVSGIEDYVIANTIGDETWDAIRQYLGDQVSCIRTPGCLITIHR